MTAWTDRAPEIAALFNPAFCGLLLYSAIEGYMKRKLRPMPYENSFLILPIVLHSPTRAELPKSVATPFQTWVNSNSVIRIGLADRVRASVPFSREALVYMLVRQCITVEKGLITGPKKPRATSEKIRSSDDLRGSVQSAALLGRLLAGAGSTATVFASLGIAP